MVDQVPSAEPPPPVIQVPEMEKQPPVMFRPFANVLVAVVEVAVK